MKRSIRKLVKLACAAGTVCIANSAYSAQFSVSCQFDTTGKNISDPVALEWATAHSLAQMQWIFETDPLRIIDGPGALVKRIGATDSDPLVPDVFWKVPTLKDGRRHIEIDFRPHARPLNRQLQLNVKIDRFSGQASRFLEMARKPDGTDRYVYWIQNGDCEIEQRRM
ncbi:hypothetical protein ACLQ8Z_03080 [Bordetella hinzii]|uniref:hypothetical protein n=1 Tax=Bordetella hinzii TaxID=103855 RepID=UPI00114F6609|nr:hypothetical protein [Bordetella hinzii]MCJ9708041.1 hypothetical protein [Bordetella hinzii]